MQINYLIRIWNPPQGPLDRVRRALQVVPGHDQAVPAVDWITGFFVHQHKVVRTPYNFIAPRKPVEHAKLREFAPHLPTHC
jgi:hypothetical protein